MSNHFIGICFVAFCILCIVSACDSTSKSAPEKKDKKVFTNLYIRYLEAEKELRAEAQFKIGDSLHLASSMSLENNIFFQGGAMEKRNINKNIIYRSLRAHLDYDEVYNFQFQDLQKVPYSVDLNMSPVSYFHFKTPVYKSKGMQLTLNKRLQRGESIVLLFTGENNNSGSLTLNGPSKDSILSFRPAQLQSLPSVKGSVYLVKKKQTSQKLGEHYFINALIEFYSKEKLIEIRD